MKKRPSRQEFPKNGATNRYHFPQSRRNTAGAAYQSIFAPFDMNDVPDYSDTDPEGSWTGVPRDGGEPTQDADDL